MTKLGVIIARFQVPYLHNGHRFIIEHALRENDAVLVILGESGGALTNHYPLDHDERRKMVQAAYPEVTVARVRDVPDDDAWSTDVDTAIGLMYLTDTKVTLYGGPDSFVPHYKGKYRAVQLDVPPGLSGTDLRTGVEPPANGLHPMATAFREGMIYAANLRRPTSFQTVDIAIIDDYTNPQHVLMGTRRGDDGLRFPGGFVDPTDESLEYAARREAAEEVPHLTADGHTYLGSYRIDDFRYRNAPDKVMTALFIAYYQHGAVEAGDDFKEARWVPLNDLIQVVASLHRPLADRVVEYITPTMRKIAAHREKQRVG